MATTNFKNEPVQTSGNVPQVGDTLPNFTLVGTDLTEFSNQDFAGQRVVLNIFPSVDTGVCAESVRRFNELAAKVDNTTVICASHDLPMALGRFCGAEGIENVTSGSGFRSSFGEDFGIVLAGSPLKGLLARTVIVADESGKITHVELVDEITTEPDYDAALAVLN